MATGNLGRPSVPGRPAANPFAIRSCLWSARWLWCYGISSSGHMAGPSVREYGPSPPVGFTDPSTLTPGPNHHKFHQQQTKSNNFQPSIPRASTNPPIRTPSVGPPYMASPMAPNMPPPPPVQHSALLTPASPLTFCPNFQAPPTKITSPPPHYAQTPVASHPDYYLQQPAYPQSPSQPGMETLHSRTNATTSICSSNKRYAGFGGRFQLSVSWFHSWVDGSWT